MRVTNPPRGPEAAEPPPAPQQPPPAATLADLVATGHYETHDIPVKLPGARVVLWRVRARELSYEEQAAISDRHTRIMGRGRRASKEINLPAVMREILAAMIDGPSCTPPLTPEDLQRLRGPAFTAFSEHFGLSGEAEEEAEQTAGESAAP